MHIHIHIYIHPCIYAYTCKRIHTYKYIYMHTYTSTHTYMHIPVYIQRICTSCSERKANVYADAHNICLRYTPAHAWCSTTPENACRLSAEIYMDLYIYIHIYMYTLHTHTHSFIHGYIYIHIRTYMYIYKYIYTYAYTHIYIYIYIYRICTSCREREANVYADVHNICLTHTPAHAWCAATPVNACLLSAKKNAYGLVYARLFNCAAASLPWRLLRTYLDSCANIVQAVVYCPP